MLKEHAIIFDLDGTLLDTLDDLTASVNAAMRTCGLPVRTREEVREFVGNGVMKLIERCIPDGQQSPLFRKAYGTFRMHYAAHCQVKTVPYDGIVTLLEKLRKMEIPVAIVSNKFDTAVKKLCEAYFSGLIAVAIGERDGIEKKPAPDTVFKALEELGMPVESAIYVGDSEVDLETAKNAGTKIVSVSWGFRDKDFLVRSGAELIADTPDELLARLEKMTE